MRFLTAVVMTHSVTNTLPRTVMRHGVTTTTLQAEQDTSVRWCVYNHEHFSQHAVVCFGAHVHFTC